MEHKKDAVVRQAAFSCPCGGTGFAGYVDRDGEKNLPTVGHTLPHCERFEKLDPYAYLLYARGKSKKKLRVYPSLARTLSVGWMRDDLPMVHVFGQAEPGQIFQPSNGHGGSHWPCSVCEEHNYTVMDFDQQMCELMAMDSTLWDA